MVKYLTLLLLPVCLYGQYVNDLDKITTANLTDKDSVNVYVEMLNGSSTLTSYKMPIDTLFVWMWAKLFNSGTSNNIAGTDSLAVTVATAPLAYAQNMMILFEADTCNTGAFVINVNSLGWKSVKSLNNQDPADNYIEVGSIVWAAYDGTNFQLLMPDANP
jgi:hypothetical protein